MKPPSTAQLRQAIREAAREAFAAVRKSHSKEDFYTFALYTNTSGTAIAPSANTVQGLRRRALEYVANGSGTLSEQIDSLKWNAGDWAYHCEGEEFFEAAEALLDSRKSPDDLEDEDADREFSLRMKLFVDVMKDLDSEGFFGKGRAREKIVLLVLMGDQEKKLLLDCAKKINPSRVYQAFSKPFLHRLVGQFRSIGKPKVYETNAIALSGNGKLLVTAGDGLLFGFTVPGLKQTLKIRYGLLACWSLAVSNRGDMSAIGYSDLATSDLNGVRCYFLPSGKKAHELTGLKRNVFALEFSPDGLLIAAADSAAIIHLWNPRTGKTVRKLRGHRHWIRSLSFARDGSLLYSCDEGKSTRIWEIESGKQIGLIPDGGKSMAITPDGKVMAVAGGAGPKNSEVRIWDLEKRRIIQRLPVISASRLKVPKSEEYCPYDIEKVAFSADGKLLVVTTGFDGTARLWDWMRKKELLTLDPDHEIITGAEFLPDGKTVALSSRSMDGPPLLLWDISSAFKNSC